MENFHSSLQRWHLKDLEGWEHRAASETVAPFLVHFVPWCLLIQGLRQFASLQFSCGGEMKSHV